MTGTEEKETRGDGSASADDSKKETDLQAAIDALQASAAALKDLVGTPPPAVMAEGSGTAVVGQVAYRMLDLAAGAIAAAVAGEKGLAPPKESLLIVERTDLARWECEHETVMLRLDALKTLLEAQGRECKGHLDSVLSATVRGLAAEREGGPAKEVERLRLLSIAGIAGLGSVVSAGALAVGNVARYLTPTLRVSARQTSLESSALVAAVAGRLAGKRQVTVLRWTPGAEAPELLKRLEAVRTAADRLAAKAAVLEAAVGAKWEDEVWRKTATAFAAASRALLERSAASLGGIGEACGPGSPLAGAMSWEGATRSDATHCLCLELVQQGGDVVERVGAMGTHVLYLGGCVVVWALVACEGDVPGTREGKVLGAGMVPVMGSFSCDPSSPGDGVFRVVRMDEEEAQVQEWLLGGAVRES